MNATARLLLIDDDDVSLMMLDSIIGNLGYSSATARTAEEAISALENEVFDLIITDLHLPGLSGTELIEFLSSRNNLSSIPVIAISAECTVNAASRMARQSNVIFLGKPFRLLELKMAIRSQLVNSRINRLKTAERSETVFRP